MSDPSNIPPDQDRDRNREAWDEVGKQFQQLGQTLAQTFRTAWNDEENRRKVREMQAGLESMVKEVGQAINDTTNTPEGQQVKQDAHRVAQTLVDAGEQTVQEVRPHLINALRQVNEELQKLVNRMEENKQDKDETPPPT